jgi:hypothetical protein
LPASSSARNTRPQRPEPTQSRTFHRSNRGASIGVVLMRFIPAANPETAHDSL